MHGLNGTFFVYKCQNQVSENYSFLLFSKQQGPVVQSIFNLTSSLVVKLLTVIVSTISYSQVFLLKKKPVQLLILTFFSAKILAYMPYLMIKVLTIH